jgi:hypothetical protein
LDNCEEPIRTKARPDEHWRKAGVEYSKNAAAAVAKRRATQRQRGYMPRATACKWRASDREKEQRRKSRREPALP